MNKPIFSLLLNYNGTVCRKSYLIAVILMLLVISIAATQQSFDLLRATILSSGILNIEDISSYYLLTQLTWAFTPVLIPFYFLATYSVLIITVKRARSLQLPIVITIIATLINYLFFNIIMKANLISSYMLGQFSNRSENQIIDPASLLYFSLAFLALGLLINLFFILSDKGECDSTIIKDALLKADTDKKNKSYGQFSYIIFLGKLLIINLSIMVFIASTIYFFRDFIEDIIDALDDIARNGLVFKVIGVLYIGIFFGLYLHATAKRLNDAGYKTRYLVLYVIIVLALTGLLSFFISLKTPLSIILLAGSQFIISIVLASQVIPILLSSKVPENAT